MHRDYDNVAAGQTDQAVGPTGGAAGDLLANIILVPLTVAMGAVSIKDGGGPAITIYPGVPAGGSYIVDKAPSIVELGMRSQAGPWRVSTGPNVEVIVTGELS